MKEMLKNAAILFAITLISGCLLGIVYDVTKEPIAEQQIKAMNEAYANVFEDADNFEEYAAFDVAAAESMMAEADLDVTIDSVNAAMDASGNVLGYVVTVTDYEGYGGDIQFSAGIRMDGTLNGISFLAISETAGLGMKADEVLSPQFVGKQVEKFAYSKTGAASDAEIDAISGATITTNAVVNGVNGALIYFQTELMEGGAGNE